MKKYELIIDDFVEIDGEKLFRIKAIVDFSNIKSGDLGGYISDESNLDHSGNAWVYDDAMVFGNAWVSGNARVYDDARVSGNARVYDDAKVSNIEEKNNEQQ